MTASVFETEYPTFNKDQIIEVKFLNKTIIEKFIEWKHKEDRPFGYFLHIEQDYCNYMDGLKKDLGVERISLQDFDVYSHGYEMNKIRSLNDQYINKINGKAFKCFPQ